jgi:hypothetical protein
MLDCFIFSVIEMKHPRFGDKLRDDLAHQRFRAVIVTPELTHNTIMRTRYELKATEGRTMVYLPKTQ